MLVITDKVSFRRIDNENCIGYKLYKIKNNGEEFIMEIENPIVPSPVSREMTLPFKKRKKWKMPEHTIGSCSFGVKVFVNHKELTTNFYTYSPGLKVLSILADLTEDDLIIVKYFVDEIEQRIETNEDCGYKIIPVFKNNFNIGRHIKL